VEIPQAQVFRYKFKTQNQKVGPDQLCPSDSRFARVPLTSVLQNAHGLPLHLEGMCTGKALFLVGGGFSAQKANLSLLQKRGLLSMGMNNAWLMFRPNFMVAVDSPNRFSDAGWKDGGILKMVPICHRNAVLGVMLKTGDKWEKRNSRFKVHEMPNVGFFVRRAQFDPKTFFEGPSVCWGNTNKEGPDAVGIKDKRSVMLCALRLAHWMGFHRVYCVGTDFHMPKEGPAYGFGEVKNLRARMKNNEMYKTLDLRLKALIPYMGQMKCWSSSQGSKMTAFPCMPYEEAVQLESEECGKEVPSVGWYT